MSWLGNPELYKIKYGIAVFDKVTEELNEFDLTYGGTWDIEKNRNNGNLNLPNGIIMNISIPIESFYLKEKDDDGIKVTIVDIPVDIDDDKTGYGKKEFKMFKNSAELSGEIKRLTKL